MVITLSGVTGVGKSYLKKEIQRRLGINIQPIVTTRSKRKGEINKIDKEFVTNEEFEEMKKNKNIIVTFEFLGNKYGYPREQMESEENSVVELHYYMIQKLKQEVKNTFSIYLIPKNIEIAKQKLKERNLPKKIENLRLKEIEEHIKEFRTNKKLREEFDYICYNDYTENTTNKILELVDNVCNKYIKIPLRKKV